MKLSCEPQESRNDSTETLAYVLRAFLRAMELWEAEPHETMFSRCSFVKASLAPAMRWCNRLPHWLFFNALCGTPSIERAPKKFRPCA